MISALAAGTGGKRYSIIFQAFASGFDYSIKNGYDDVIFGNKRLIDGFTDLGTSFAPGLGKKMASPGNHLGPKGVDFIGNSFGILGGEMLKKQY